LARGSVRPPAAETRDVGSAGDGDRLAQEAGHIGAVGEDDAPDAQRGGYLVDERSEARRVELPHLDLDRPRTLGAGPDAEQAWFRRVGRQREQAVDRRGPGRRHELRTAAGELTVERLAAEVGTDDRDSHRIKVGAPGDHPPAFSCPNPAVFGRIGA